MNTSSKQEQHKQSMLYETITMLSLTLDAGQILRLLAERLAVLFDVTSTRIASLDDKLHTAIIVAQYHSPLAHPAEQNNAQGEVYSLNAFPRTLAALRARQPLLVTSACALREWHDVMVRRQGQVMLLLPLVARNRAIGFAELWDSQRAHNFTKEEIRLSQVLTSQAAIAFQNALFFAETQRRLGELTLLYDIAVAADFSLDLDTILQSVVRMLQHVMDVTDVRILLVDPEQTSLQSKAHTKHSASPNEIKDIPLGEGISGKVAQTGQPILIADLQSTPELDTNDCDQTRSVLAVPLLALGQRVIGVLYVQSRHENAFSQQDLRLLRTMAGSLARSIENVRLFAELKHSQEGLVLRNRALEKANDRLQELDRLKSTFIASVNHELRTPLNSIIGFSQVLIDGLAGDFGPVAQEYLGYIHTSGEHLLDLINDILDLSKIQAGRMTLELSPINLTEMIQETYKSLAPLIDKKEQIFAIEHNVPVPPIIADRIRLKQILINLMSNANKFTPIEGKITIKTSMLDPDTLRLDVIDNGIGIPLEEQSLIFEEFKQARTTRTPDNISGTGLGLAISRQLVELHGGRIWMQSQAGPNSGSKFTVLLPIAGPESAPGEI